MQNPLEIIAGVLRPGPIGEHPGAPEMVAQDIVQHIEAAGYKVFHESEGAFLPAGHVALPKSKAEAEMMNIVSERFLWPERFKTAASPDTP